MNEFPKELIERCALAWTLEFGREGTPETIAATILRESGHAELVEALLEARHYVVIEWGRAQRRSAEDLGAAERLEKENLDRIDAALRKAGAL